jgi:hypothetical protein
MTDPSYYHVHLAATDVVIWPLPPRQGNRWNIPWSAAGAVSSSRTVPACSLKFGSSDRRVNAFGVVRRGRPRFMQNLYGTTPRARRMHSHWGNNAAYYRCRFPAEYALAPISTQEDRRNLRTTARPP